jgi:predicted enzyme related to lactoylglutathione lyase
MLINRGKNSIVFVFRRIMEIKNTTIIMATKDNDEAMAKFYMEILGFTKNENGGYDQGNIKVFFDRHNKAAKQALEPFRVMLTFAVDDINKAYKELKGKGVEFVKAPAKEEWGGWFATFKDPDGNYLQIFSM